MHSRRCNSSPIFHISIYLMYLRWPTPNIAWELLNYWITHLWILQCKGNNMGIHCAKSSELTVMLTDKAQSRTSWCGPLTSCIPLSHSPLLLHPFSHWRRWPAKTRLLRYVWIHVWFRNTSPTPEKSHQEQLDCQSTVVVTHHYSMQQPCFCARNQRLDARNVMK